MDTHPVWLASQVALWLLTLVQAFLLFAVMRQVGIIHIRLASSQGSVERIYRHGPTTTLEGARLHCPERNWEAYRPR